MTHFKTLFVGAMAAALCAGAASAQSTTGGSMSSGSTDSMSAGSSGSMSAGGMNSGGMKMSKMDMKTMKSCQAMDHDAMMKAGKCKTFMSAHPDMFNADGSMKSMTPQ